jgi:hypothetical protein
MTLSWTSCDYPKLATAFSGGLEYTIWEHQSIRRPGTIVYTLAERTPLNGLRQRREKRRLVEIPNVAQALTQAQQWADERAAAA